jgi:hypothetical protein
MKKVILLTACLSILVSIVYSQTNTFPTSGNTGIGTTTPQSNLQVVGGQLFIGSPVNKDSYDQLYSAGDNPGFRLEVQRNWGGAAFDFASLYAHKTSGPGDALWGKLGILGYLGPDGTSTTPVVTYMYIGTEPTVSYSNNTFRLYPNKTAYFDGNVGIGTTAPVTKLDVRGTVSIGTSKLLTINPDYPGSGELPSGSYLGTNGSNALAFAPSADVGAAGTKVVFCYYSTGWHSALEYANVSTGYSNLLLMKSGGNVGIGTTTPNTNASLDVNGNIFTNSKIAIGTTDMNQIGAYSLAVNGTAIFTKAVVKLNSAWPDYVFMPEYKMPKLDSLECFINTNGHLPDVPTAEDVKKNGIDLGQNQALLLKKIEELTLIVIEQSKRIEKLEKGNQLKSK